MTARREFLRQASAGVASMAGGVMPRPASGRTANEWDLSWSGRLKGRHRAVFDIAEIESGFGVHRAALWAGQCVDVLGGSPDDVSLVIVLRAHAVVLALQQPFWDHHGIGRLRQVTHPVTLKPTSRNPLLMDETDGLPAALVGSTLPHQLAHGAIVLACDSALRNWVDVIRVREKVPTIEARKTAVAALVPGVILQPSGVLAAVIAQQQGCSYIRAS